MNNIARHHHFIPQFYLAGFTLQGKKDSIFHIFDIIEYKHFENIPRNVGAKRDFNRVDLPDEPIDLIEKALPEFESHVASVIKNIIQSESLPDINGEDFSALMHFMALLYVRNPQPRGNFADAQIKIAKIMAQQLVARKDRWENAVEKLREEGKDFPKEVTYEQMKSFVEEERYKVTIPTGYHVMLEFKVIKDTIPYFFERKWTLLVASDRAGNFVSSDFPISLHWIKPPYQRYIGPGLAHIETELTFPLSRSMALVGRFDKESRKMQANAKMVAIVNGYTISMADRHVYSPEFDFSFMAGEGEIHSSEMLLSEPN